ncbi:DUF4426 domain-containing protein [Thalassotalea sp. 1_MG-2023]|uniref:DUF4426 domain-containing protein n=1 Tax=Thalassotalea sp. 1_MG-2023 TaxID=3062680 RepID=UPI0026E13EB8|nr:DUF4426 domain-containing protein [Thalassotalea sp. 1_MG-2023]MDO6426779.1 DUF4426 domain-containing protein [Thalassotalea sp. 1_MG-2023]
MQLSLKKFFRHLSFALPFAFLMLNNANAENMKKLGDMNVHYMAISATFLTPEVAKAYGIERSNYNGLINIAVMDNTIKGNPAQKVKITGKAVNLLGQDKDLNFEEVVEGDAVYYLAQVMHRNEETIRFNLTIDNGREQQQLSFKHKFYTD